MNDNEARIVETAVSAARAAGVYLKTNVRRQQTVHAVGQHDVKLEADTEAEKIILEQIRGTFPDHAILTEEGGADEVAGDYRWTIDPRDGTVNYYYGLPYYCVSIACHEVAGGTGKEKGIASLGRPVAGVVYAPPTDDLFVGRAGLGATLNNEAIRAGGVKDLGEAIFSLGYGKTNELARSMASASALLADRVRKLRSFGAAAFDLANVACGRLSGFFELSLRTWDIAAAAVILGEAGGKIHAQEFEPTKWRILACAPGISEEVKTILSAI